MKLLHLSDLHIGKRVNEFSMLEDQGYILTKIVKVVDEEKPDAVLICGDVYDKAVPSAEAVALFDDFLVSLSNRNLAIFVISGNHDSPERIAFGARIMNASGVYMSPVYHKDIVPIELSDEEGSVNFYMLPFIKPAQVRVVFPEDIIETYEDAVKTAISKMAIDQTKRNVILAHQFITDSQRSGSEDISVGGADNVSASLFDAFDYVALGHIHKAQNVRKETLRYCGTPLKYSLSEADHTKSITIIQMYEKGNINIYPIELTPLRDMTEIKGTYMELTSKSYYKELNLENYYYITLTDEEDIPDVMNKLRTIYKNIMNITYDNKRTREVTVVSGANDVEKKSPQALVSEFYELQNNQPISKEQEAFVANLIEKIWEGENETN